jgi:hypothetical protein
MAGISGAAFGSALEADQPELVELSELRGDEDRRPSFTDIEKQLQDEEDLMAEADASFDHTSSSHEFSSLPANASVSPSPVLKPFSSISSPASPGAPRDIASVSVRSPSSRALVASSAARTRQVLMRFKQLAKFALWRFRRVEGFARHQMWWLIAGTKRVLKRSESQMNFKAETTESLVSIDDFLPISGIRQINRLPWYIIDPQGTFSVYWTLWMTLLMVYCAITIPYFIAFEQIDALRWTDVVVDVMFFFDIVFSFVTAYVKYEAELDYQLEISLRVLAKRYARGWLLFDLIGTIPFTEIMRDTVVGADSYPRLIKVVRILRLLKLLRLSRFGKKANFIKNLLKVHVGIFRGVKFFVFFALLAHIMANVLVITAVFASDDHAKPMNWLSESRGILIDGYGMVPISESSEGSRYLMALYWAFTTIITLGYGDIYPVQTAEAGVCLVNMIIGAAVFSFIVGNVASILAAADSSRGIDAICADLKHTHKFPAELQRKIKLW